MNTITIAYPSQVSTDIFREYHSGELYGSEVNPNTGIMVEDGLCEIWFKREKEVELESAGKRMDLFNAFVFGKVALPYKLIIPEKVTFFAVKIQPWATWYFDNDPNNPITQLSEEEQKGVDQLSKELFQKVSMDERVKLVEEFLGQFEFLMTEEMILCRELCEEIYMRKGMVKVNE